MKPFQTNILTQSLSTDNVDKFFVEVVLGRPSANCRHLGICKIERAYRNFYPEGEFVKRPINKVFALAAFKANQYFELTFDRSSLDDLTFEKYFEDEVFTMEEAYAADEKVLNKSFEISSGLYPVTVNDTLLSVRFYFELTA